VESREPYTEASSWQIAAGSSDVSRSQLVEWSTRGAKSKAQSGKRRRQRAAGSSVPSAECGVRNADTKFWPVMKPAASEIRKATKAATSRNVPSADLTELASEDRREFRA